MDPESKWCSREKELKNRDIHDGISLIKSWKYWGILIFFVFVISVTFSEENPNIIKPRTRPYNNRPKRQIEEPQIGLEKEYRTGLEEIMKAKMELNKSVVLKIASVNSLPFQTLNTTEDGQITGTGFSFEVLDTLANFFNFSYEIIVPKDNGFGSLKEIDGVESWTGMIGVILDKEASIGVAAFTETIQRKRVVDFSVSLYEDEVGILINKPDKMDNAGALFQPFTKGVWLLIVLACVAMGPSFFILRKIQLKLFKGTEAYHKIKDYSLADCVWFVYAGLVKQGINVKTTLDSGRIFFATWWLFTLLITSFYTANLTAFLTLPVYHADETLSEMLQVEHLRWTLMNNTALENEIHNVSLPEFELLRESLKDGHGVMINTEEEALDLITKKGYIFLNDAMIIKDMVVKYYLEHKQCDILVADYSFHTQRYAFVYDKAFKYGKAFNEYIETLKRTGLIKKWIRQYLIQKTPCSKEALAASQSAEASGSQSLTVADCLSVFMSYVFGIGAGLLLVVLERLYFSQKSTTPAEARPKIMVTTGNVHGYAPYIRPSRHTNIKTIYSGR